MRNFLRRYNIALQMLLLVSTISALAYFNYDTQKNVFLNQLDNDAVNIGQTVRASIERFYLSEQTLGIQPLVESISMGLNIFELRYLDETGITIGSMFRDEIGKPFLRDQVQRLIEESQSDGQFYEEIRDFTDVMAISYPVRRNNRLVGIIDLAVDITSYHYQQTEVVDVLREQKQRDVRNLLNAVSGSILNALKVMETVNIDEFLHHLVINSHSVLTINILDGGGLITAASNREEVGRRMTVEEIGVEGLFMAQEKAMYRMHVPLNLAINDGAIMQLMVDASAYEKNQSVLLKHLIATALMVIGSSLAIAWSIYTINMERAKRENVRLESMVRDRTAEIERLSKIDKLTGLGNRAALDEGLEREFLRATRYQHPLSMLVVDLDLFKIVNDTYGHLAGDEVLREVGARLRAQLRDTDVIGRYGGEEFVILLPETPLEASLKIAEEIRQVIEQDPVRHEDIIISVTASIGVAMMESGTGNHSELFAHADSALYHAKHSGRNGVSFMKDGRIRSANYMSS